MPRELSMSNGNLSTRSSTSGQSYRGLSLVPVLADQQVPQRVAPGMTRATCPCKPVICLGLGVSYKQEFFINPFTFGGIMMAILPSDLTRACLLDALQYIPFPICGF